MLMPVPEYPVVSKKLDEDESATQPDNSLYNEDGSLEASCAHFNHSLKSLHFLPHIDNNHQIFTIHSMQIDLSSLVDIRIVKGGNTGPRNTSPSCENGPLGNENSAKPELPSSNDKQLRAAVPGIYHF